MKQNTLIYVLIALVFLSLICNAFCSDELSYDETVKIISETMANNTSSARKENYVYIKLNKCSLDYNVTGTYPVGDLYNMKFTNIDFSSINEQMSKTGHDYTAFIMLNFKNYVQYKDDSNELNIRTVVVNVSTDEKAQMLFDAFLHLGKLCGAQN